MTTQKSPRYIETIPKKGYRLIASPRYSTRTRIWSSKTLAAVTFLALVAAAIWLSWTPNAAIVITDPDAVAENFTARPGAEQYPTLSPDGQYLAYVEYQAGNQNLLIADVASRRIRNAWKAPGIVLGLAFAPSGDRLAIVNRSQQGCQVKVMTLMTGDITDLTGCWGWRTFRHYLEP